MQSNRVNVLQNVGVKRNCVINYISQGCFSQVWSTLKVTMFLNILLLLESCICGYDSTAKSLQ